MNTLPQTWSRSDEEKPSGNGRLDDCFAIPEIRSGIILDCQHMAKEAIDIGADLARIAAQECAGAPCSADALLYLKQRIEGLQVFARISHEKVAEMDRVKARKVKS